MWEIITNISSVFTCILFIMYIIGHIWIIYISKDKIFEKLEFEYIEDKDYEKYQENYFIDLAGEYGSLFSISSPEGIKKIKVFGVDRIEEPEIEYIKGHFIEEFSNIKPNEKVYFRGYFSDFSSNISLEIERGDYIKTFFIVSESERNGEIYQMNQKSKMTFKSWIYYLCT